MKKMLVMLALVSGFGFVLPGRSNAKTSDLLTPSQVQALLTSATTAADDVTLQKHFSALADTYEVDANKHAAEAQANRDNPNPGSHFPGSAALRAQHCDRLAESARASAQEVRELASAYEQKTPADHLRLRQYLSALVDNYQGDANKHAAEAQRYRENWNPGSHFPGSAAMRAKHCDRLAESARNSAAGARELSSKHGRMAAAL